MIKLTSLALIAFFQLLSLFPIRFLRTLGRPVGRLLWLLNGRARHTTEENLAICFPLMERAERAALARDSLQHLAMTALELGPVWRRSVSRVLVTISTVEGEHVLQQAWDEGRGVIILAPHIGCWELLGLHLAEHYPLTTLYQPPDNPAMDALMLKARSRNSSGLPPANIKGVKQLLQRLKKGELIAILPDQVPPAEGGDFAPFFGVPALTTTLVKNMVKRTEAKVVIACALRESGTGTFKIIFDTVPDELYSADTQLSLAAMNQAVEHCVLRAPEQYQWEYKRFKKQPGGERKYYQ